MVSPDTLLKCDGSFGCDCPQIRARNAEKKRKQNEWTRRWKERQKAANGRLA